MDIEYISKDKGSGSTWNPEADLNASPDQEAEGKSQLSAVLEIARAIGSKTELDDILSTITVQMSNVLDFDLGCVSIFDKDKNCLFLRHIYRKNGDKTGEGRYVALDESNLVGWVAINRKPVLRNNIPEDRRFREIMKEDGLKSDIVVPLIIKSRFVGTINFGSFKQDNYSRTDLEILGKFSTLASIAIEKSDLLQNLENIGGKYRILMDMVDDLIVLLDLSGTIIECNSAVKAFGYSKREVKGRSPADFALPANREAVERNFGKVLRGDITRAVEIPCLRKDGKIIYMDINFSIFKIKDQPYILVVGHDVTDRKILEERITIQNRELVESNKMLKELDQLKSDFLGRISHELRTPLSVIMAYTDTLLNEDEESLDQGTRKEFLQVVESQSRNLLGLINDLLDLSKVEVSETMLNVSEGSINEITDAAVDITRPFAVQEGVEIMVSLDDSIPIMRFDPLRIKQILVNLINNAVKFTPEGKPISIATSRTDDEAVVSVSDNGSGIDEEDVEGIFDDFTQIDGGRTRSSNGMGIGLRLVKHYIDLHGGKVWVESEKGKGSVFCFSLPLQDVSLKNK